MKKKLSLTKTQQAYKKELQKLKNRIAYQRRKGYKVDSEKIIPKKPTRITSKSIEELKNIRAKQIKEASTYEPKQTENFDEPTFDYIHAVEELIEELPNDVEVVSDVGTARKHRKTRKFLDLSPFKNEMLNALWDTYNEYDNITEYNNYLGTVFGKIQSSLNPDYFPSDEEELIHSLANVIRLIQKKSMTQIQARTISDGAEML